jgi:serine protease inhibitor
MKRLRLPILSIVTLLSLTVCTAGSSPDSPDAVDAEHLVKGNTAFALALYSRLHQQEGNLFFSPYSISTALAMTYGGARGGTREQMAKALTFSLEQSQLHGAFARLQAQLNTEQDKGDIELTVANALWAEKQYSFLEDFIHSTNKNYGAPLNRVDFKNTPEETRTQINEWVEQKTNDKIKDLIQPGVLNDLTRLVLTNALYFRGNWSRQFNERATREDQFWIAPDKAIMVPLMTQTDYFAYWENERMQVLELPYVGSGLSMIFFLPRTIDGLSAIETALTVDTLTDWTQLPSRKREIRVTLPKFTVTSAFNLEKILGAMGMPDAFTPQADFSGMTGNRELYINAVIHKAFVDVNEKGTEAAAATALALQKLSYGNPPPEFRADHPFLFLIRHTPSESILFLGRVADPAQ